MLSAWHVNAARAAIMSWLVKLVSTGSFDMQTRPSLFTDEKSISSLSNNANCSNCISIVSKWTQSEILQLAQSGAKIF